MKDSLKGKIDVVCVGASLVDLAFRCKSVPIQHTSNPSLLTRSPGGVTRNIAHHLALLGCSVELITVLGKDPDGEWLGKICRDAGIGLNYVHYTSAATGTYASIVNPEGGLFVGAAASDTDEQLTIEILAERIGILKQAKILIADCNLSSETLRWLISFCETEGIPIVIETVSVPKAFRLEKALPGKVLMIKPNKDELEVFGGETNAYYSSDERITWLHSKGVKYVWMSAFEDGSVLSDGTKQFSIPAPKITVRDSTGAGDAALAGWVWAYLQNLPPLVCVQYGHAAAGAVLETAGAIRNDLNVSLLQKYLVP
ncbi:MAG TPA: carbohydrate kinase family protein [Bacteroidia bacterium]|nr:carbohydrate kinase family protein [Bacteroidia bacterium]